MKRILFISHDAGYSYSKHIFFFHFSLLNKLESPVVVEVFHNVPFQQTFRFMFGRCSRIPKRVAKSAYADVQRKMGTGDTTFL